MPSCGGSRQQSDFGSGTWELSLLGVASRRSRIHDGYAWMGVYTDAVPFSFMQGSQEETQAPWWENCLAGSATASRRVESSSPLTTDDPVERRERDDID